jgi:hypothetical protein
MCTPANDTNDILESIDMYDISINGSEHNLTLLTGMNKLTYENVKNELRQICQKRKIAVYNKV